MEKIKLRPAQINFLHRFHNHGIIHSKELTYQENLIIQSLISKGLVEPDPRYPDLYILTDDGVNIWKTI